MKTDEFPRRIFQHNYTVRCLIMKRYKKKNKEIKACEKWGWFKQAVLS